MNKTPKSSKKTPKVKPSKVERDPLTDEQTIEEWVGFVKNLHKIVTTKLWDDNWRITVYTAHKSEGDGRLFPDYKITQSYFVQIIDGEVTDKTIAPKELADKPMPFF